MTTPLHFPLALGRDTRALLEVVLARLPRIEGRPVRVRFLPKLRVHRGKLRSGKGRGSEVHAGTFLRDRVLVLDGDLLPRPRELARILVHEVFHFAWARLGNPRRRAFEDLLRSEISHGARGELGWSAERRKKALSAEDRLRRTRRWREYVCESFCDSAAWVYCGRGRHSEYTLAPRFREVRRAWFRDSSASGCIRI